VALYFNGEVMAYLFLGVGALLLFALSFMNATTGMFEAAAAYGLFGFLLVAFSAIYIFAIKPANEKVSRDRILEWLKKNEAKVLSSGLEYKGRLVNGDTVLISYCIVYSAVFFTRKDFSNYCIKGSGRSYLIGIISTIFNLVMGWWGIPWGLIYTPQSLYINLSKTHSYTVKQVLNEKI
jgi:hypothetical protein